LDATPVSKQACWPVPGKHLLQISEKHLLQIAGHGGCSRNS
jgi:hypothetical protein